MSNLPDIYSMPAKREGDVYCAPWCGRKCTWEEHQDAHRKGANLAKRMGPGWTPLVWENLGWHYEVQSPCRFMTISERWNRPSESASVIEKLAASIPSYTAYLNDDRDRSGGRWLGKSRDGPHAAAKDAFDKAKAERDELVEIVNGLEAAYGS